jgi:hypothetical protein
MHPMRFRNFGVLAGSLFALVAVTAGGCSSTAALVDALNTDAGIGAKPDGASGDEDGSTIVDEDTGTGTKDGGQKDSSGNGDSAITDASSDAINILPKVDASPLADGGVCPGKAPTFSELETAGGWNPPPAVSIGACSAANITQFHNNFTGATSFNDLKTGLPTGCASCIFSVETSSTWSFVVTDTAGTLGFFNYGACYARAQFGSNACGKGVQYSEFCLTASCSECSTGTAQSACEKGTQAQSACSTNFAGQIQAGCGTNTTQLNSLDTDCGTAVSAVNVLCGTGP